MYKAIAHETFPSVSEFELSVNYVIFVFKFISNQFISMKIHSFTYRDRETNREVKPIHLKDLTLLVGASGVGKTEILHAIRSIKEIAQGDPFNGVSWNICFSIGEDTYTWEGEFDNWEKGELFNGLLGMLTNGTNGIPRRKPTVIYEKIVLNNEVLLEREGTNLTFKGSKSPVPIKAEQSALSLIPDPLIKRAENEFKKIIYSDYSQSAYGLEHIPDIPIAKLKKYKNINEKLMYLKCLEMQRFQFV